MGELWNGEFGSKLMETQISTVRSSEIVLPKVRAKVSSLLLREVILPQFISKVMRNSVDFVTVNHYLFMKCLPL